MIAMRHSPAPPLDGSVDCFWYFDDYFASHQRERALPTGTVEMVVNLLDDPIRVYLNDCDQTGCEFGGAIVCGRIPVILCLTRRSSGASRSG
jgi:hypothetical protein